MAGRLRKVRWEGKNRREKRSVTIGRGERRRVSAEGVRRDGNMRRGEGREGAKGRTSHGV